MSMRGGAPKGKDVGRVMTSSSGVRDLSPWRHDSGGSCRLPEKRLRPRRRSTPSVQDGDVNDSLRQQSAGSLLSWWWRKRRKRRNLSCVTGTHALYLHSGKVSYVHLQGKMDKMGSRSPAELEYISFLVSSLKLVSLLKDNIYSLHL